MHLPSYHDYIADHNISAALNFEILQYFSLNRESTSFLKGLVSGIPVI
jgi:hypothetical protein